MKRHRTAPLVILLACSALLAACGGDDDDEAGSGAGGQEDHGEASGEVVDGARQIEVVAEDLSFDPAEITATVGEDLAVSLTSGDMLHDFTIDELDAHVAAGRGDTEVGGFSALEAGTYTYYCSVAGHRSAGMEGVLTVE